MTYQEIIHYWYYFCSLCDQLEITRKYVDHRAIERDGHVEFENGNSSSNAFLQILLSASSEFETIGKLLCKEVDPQFKDKANIVEISTTILTRFPNIGKTLVRTDYLDIQPLEEWSVVKKSDGNQCVNGLKWWDGYTSIKHSRYSSFKEANLENCVMALASLLVLELYLCKQVIGQVNELSAHGCPYFKFRYGCEPYWARCPDNLPDFTEQ